MIKYLLLLIAVAYIGRRIYRSINGQSGGTCNNCGCNKQE